MLFNSYQFLFFLPIVFCLYWFVFKTRKWQNALIVVASYVFYGWWDWRFLILIALTSGFSYVSGRLMEKFEMEDAADDSLKKKARRKQMWVSAVNIIINIGILGVFKYYNFFVDNLQALLGLFGIHFDWVTLNIILPVGISFYTFQALSYSIDVYQRKIKASHDVAEFFAYISFFPQLVAGPIERATNLLPQFQKERAFERPKAVDGLRQMLWGFFKKLVIADNCATIVNENWANYHNGTSLSLFILGVLFTFQIYADFSGYSDIAIGCARLFGFNLMRNFHFPYFSRSIPEFWRRWHISLTTWFRDYIYFPLGGSRCAKWKIIRNVFIVWAVSGLWHGANWTFVCWGLFHALLLNFYNLFGINTKYEHIAAHGRILPTIKETIQILVTFFFAVIGWIIFRAENMSQAADFIARMFTGPFYSSSSIRGGTYVIMGCILLAIEWIQREKQHALQIQHEGIFKHRWVRWAAYYAVIAAIGAWGGSSQTFIYFQF